VVPVESAVILPKISLPKDKDKRPTNMKKISEEKAVVSVESKKIR
jgi:hypothetical protein